MVFEQDLIWLPSPEFRDGDRETILLNYIQCKFCQYIGGYIVRFHVIIMNFLHPNNWQIGPDWY